MPTVQPTCTCAAPCLSPICDQGFRPAREMIRVMRAADAKENRTDSHLQVLITTSMFTNIAGGSENSAAQRLSPWRKGTRRRESRRRATSPEKAREREREQLQRAHSHRARRAQRAHKGHPAPLCAVRFTPNSRRGRGARFMKPQESALQKRFPPKKRSDLPAAAICLWGVILVNDQREHPSSSPPVYVSACVRACVPETQLV
jgi:hypothetical protein